MPGKTFIQVEGSGFRIDAERLKEEFERSGELRRHLQKYLLANLVQEDVQISAAINGNMRQVSGVAAFICEIAGHIFFVRISDLDQELSAVRGVPDGDHPLH